MMNRWKWTGLAAGLLMAAMTVLPVGRALAATDNPGILPGGEGLKGAGVSHVYYGEHRGEPIYSRVLAREGNGLLVLSEYILENMMFDNMSRYSNDWEGSMAQEWCKALYTDGFTGEEKGAILATSKTEDGPYKVNNFTFKGSLITGEHLYFLSAKEAANPAYGFEGTGTSDSSRVAYRKDDKTRTENWWLRSGRADNTIYVGYVFTNGFIDISSVVGGYFGGRPALQINLNSVLFASAAVGGKGSGNPGAAALEGILGNSTEDWKLTLKDANRKFGVSNKEGKRVKAGQSVTLDYTGAKTGNKEYVSAMVLDGQGTPVYYGRMKAVAAGEESGQVEIGIPAGLAVGEYTLQVFNEQYNGDKETDYASVPVEIPVKVVDQANVQPPVEESKIAGVPVNATQGERIEFTATGAGMDNLTPVGGDERWKPLSWQVNPSGDFADGNYTKSFDTTGMTPGEHRLTVTYAKERYDGGAWMDTGERRTQEFAFTLAAAPSQGGGEQPTAPPTAPGETGAATPGDLTGDNPGTGDGVRIGWLMAAGAGALFATAVLIRQRKKA